MPSNDRNNTRGGELVDIDFNPNFNKLQYSITDSTIFISIFQIPEVSNCNIEHWLYCYEVSTFL